MDEKGKIDWEGKEEKMGIERERRWDEGRDGREGGWE